MSDYCKEFVVRYRPTKEQLMEVIGETYDEEWEDRISILDTLYNITN